MKRSIWVRATRPEKLSMEELEEIYSAFDDPYMLREVADKYATRIQKLCLDYLSFVEAVIEMEEQESLEKFLVDVLGMSLEDFDKLDDSEKSSIVIKYEFYLLRKQEELAKLWGYPSRIVLTLPEFSDRYFDVAEIVETAVNLINAGHIVSALDVLTTEMHGDVIPLEFLFKARNIEEVHRARERGLTGGETG